MLDARAADFPSAAAFYLTIAAVALAAGTVAALVARRRTWSAASSWRALRDRLDDLSLTSRRPTRRRTGAHWATRRDLRSLTVTGTTRGRLTLGISDGRTLVAERLHSVLVVGPTGSRKTTSLAIPNLHEWDGPAVCTSVKTDLLEATIDARRARGRVLVFDPTGMLDTPTDRWNPLDGCHDWEHRDLLRAHALPGRDVLRWIDTQEVNEVQAAIERSDHDLARHAWTAQTRKDPKLRSSIYTSAEIALAAFADERVLETTTASDIHADGVLDGTTSTLYLLAPVDRQEQLKTIFAALLDEIRAAAYAHGSAQPLDPPLLFLLDELPNIALIPELDKLASTARGQGIQVMTLVQDLAQLYARYGENPAESIINNHRAKLILPGAADPRTLQWTARITGDREAQQTSHTARGGIRDSTTESTTLRPLAPAHLVREQPEGTALLVYGSLLPVSVELAAHVG